MRHGKKFNHLGRQKGHRAALLRNLSIALITHKRINTTLAKAKALRLFLEPILTKSKDNAQHSRRIVFSMLMNKEAVTELFDTIGPKIADRPGGYLRIIKTGTRFGDAAETAMIELVDYNEVYAPKGGVTETASKSRRRKRGKGGAAAGAVAAAATAGTVVATESAAEEEE